MNNISDILLTLGVLIAVFAFFSIQYYLFNEDSNELPTEYFYKNNR